MSPPEGIAYRHGGALVYKYTIQVARLHQDNTTRIVRRILRGSARGHLLGLLLLLVPRVYAQELSVTATPQAAQMMIGEQVRIQLSVRTSDPARTQIIVPADSSVLHAEVLAFTFTDTVKADAGVQEIKAEMLITSFDSLPAQIPPFTARLGALSQSTPPITIQVALPEVDLAHPDQYYGPKEPFRLRLKFIDYLLLILTSPYFWILLGLLLIIGALLLYRRYRLRHPRAPKEQDDPPLSAYQLLQTDLKALMNRLSDGSLTQEAYYNALTERFKRYSAPLLRRDTSPLTEGQLAQLWRTRLSADTTSSTNQNDLLPALRRWQQNALYVRFAAHVIPLQEALGDAQTLLQTAAQDSPAPDTLTSSHPQNHVAAD